VQADNAGNGNASTPYAHWGIAAFLSSAAIIISMICTCPQRPVMAPSHLRAMGRRPEGLRGFCLHPLSAHLILLDGHIGATGGRGAQGDGRAQHGCVTSPGRQAKPLPERHAVRARTGCGPPDAGHTRNSAVASPSCSAQQYADDEQHAFARAALGSRRPASLPLLGHRPHAANVPRPPPPPAPAH
jgi:hypothetical protein